MTKFPFAHDGPIMRILDDDFDIVHYARDGRKYRRVRRLPSQAWDDTTEREISNDEFWMILACIERRDRNASH